MRVYYILPILIGIIGTAVSFSAYFTYKNFEDRKAHQEILSGNKETITNIQRHINENLNVIHILKAFYDASSNVTRADFQIFTAPLLEANPDIQALEWVPKVTHAQRDAFKQQAIQDGYTHYEIIEPDLENGGFKVSERRDVYYPVYYLEPYEGNEKVLGLDPPFNEPRTLAIKQATETGEITSTTSLILTQETKQQKAVLIFNPVYKGTAPLIDIEDRHNRLSGLILMALRISDTVNYVLARDLSIPKGVTVTDITDPRNPSLLFKNAENIAGSGLSSSNIVDVAGRDWQITVYPVDAAAPPFMSRRSELVFVIGMALNFFIIYIIFQLIHRRRIIENIVAQRTKEVQELSNAMEKTVEGVSVVNTQGQYIYTNEAFNQITGYTAQELIGRSWLTIIHPSHMEQIDAARQSMMQTGKATEETLGMRKDGSTFDMGVSLISKFDEQNQFIGNFCFMSDISLRKSTENYLKQANEELEEFAYRTSHDLRSPLVSSISLLELAETAIKDNNTDMAVESIRHTHRALTKLDKLVQDILALTKTKNIDEEDTPVDIAAMVEDSLMKHSHMANFNRLQIRKDFRYLAPLKLKHSRITLIIGNLVSNAIKYQDLSETISYIEISTYQDDADFVFCVKDNGLGIAQEHHKKLFKMFQRFHNKVSFGSGLGLYMMKKSADIMGGEIIFEPLEKGSSFKLIIPINKKDRS